MFPDYQDEEDEEEEEEEEDEMFFFIHVHVFLGIKIPFKTNIYPPYLRTSITQVSPK